MVEVKKAEDDSPTYWGATEKVCPVCQETIPISVLQCPYCKQTFDDMRPKTRADLIRQGEDPRWREYRHKAIWLFVFSALGFTSPLALLIGGIWYRSHRKEIEQAGTTTQALSLTGLGISLLYVVLITFGLLVWHVRH
jgi:hypothetical protein